MNTETKVIASLITAAAATIGGYFLYKKIGNKRNSKEINYFDVDFDDEDVEKLENAIRKNDESAKNEHTIETYSSYTSYYQPKPDIDILKKDHDYVEADPNTSIEYISEDEFATSDYTPITFNAWLDGIISDDLDDPIGWDTIEGSIGKKIFDDLKWSEDMETFYIRNNKKKCDYEVICHNYEFREMLFDEPGMHPGAEQLVEALYDDEPDTYSSDDDDI